ncbi:hypothetical protein IT400_04025 [Candidatus Nomurabacteria bacterium]|nr:hypothetical protein [Candidatus Nomurabacteria bacterium]
MKNLVTLTHCNMILSVNGLKFEDITKILAIEASESKVRSSSYLYNILFGPYFIDESKNKKRVDEIGPIHNWDYLNQFAENMDRIDRMIAKKMITLPELYTIIFSDKTLREVLCGNGYFPKEGSKM